MSPRAATPAFERWMAESIAPIANGLKLRGKGCGYSLFIPLDFPFRSSTSPQSLHQ